MKKSVLWLSAYILVVLIAALSYWLTWIVKPDSFIINPQMNIQPFQSIQHFLWEDDADYQVSGRVDLYKLKSDYDGYYNKINGIEREIAKIEERHADLDRKLEELTVQRDKDLELKFSKYEEEKLQPYKAVEATLEHELKLLEQKLPETIITEEDLATLKAVGNKKVELAGARVNSATQAVNNSEYLLNNITAFFSQEVRDSFHEISLTRKSLYESYYEYVKMRDKQRMTAIKLVESDLKKIRERVSFGDFFFYSVGISTTTTFGDLVANSTFTKSLVSAQLLLCIVLVAGFLGSVVKQS